MNRSTSTLVAWLLIAILVAGSLLAWGSLPEKIPTHFGISGKPDSWDEKSFWSWFLMPIIALATTILFTWLSRWTLRRPDVINLPNKERLLRLTLDRQRQVVIKMNGIMGWMSVGLNLLFCMIQYSVYRTANGSDEQTLVLAVIISSIVLLPMISLWMIVAVQSRIDTLYKEQMKGA